jgi:large subunit ribosomal protein L7/L12
MADIKVIAEQLVNLTVKQVKELTDLLKTEYGIEPAAAVAVAAPAQAANADAQAEEKSSFDIILKHPGGQKLNVVKLVKELTGLGLKESKDLVDASPKPVKEGISKEEAESIKARLEEVGAEVEIK